MNRPPNEPSRLAGWTVEDHLDAPPVTVFCRKLGSTRSREAGSRPRGALTAPPSMALAYRWEEPSAASKAGVFLFFTELSRIHGSNRISDQRRKWKHWVISSLATVRRTAGKSWYAKSPCHHRCGREPGLPNRPRDRVCGSEERGSERHRRLLGGADPGHFSRHHLSPRRPVSGPHDIRLRRDAAPLPTRGGLCADRPLRGHRPLRTEPAARTRRRGLVEARFRIAAMPFP